MKVGQIFTKIGNFIQNRQIFMLPNCNCAKLANFEIFFNTLRGGAFCRGHSVGGAVCSTPQSLADSHYQSVVQ